MLSSESSAFVSNGVSGIRLKDNGGLFSGNWLTEGPGGTERSIFGIVSSGIWVAKVSPPYRMARTSHLHRLPGVELWNQAADSSKIFLIGETTQEQRYANWPAWLGAPVHADGSLKKYGSEMAWAVFRPTTDTQYGETLEGIRIAITVFVTDLTGMQDVIFVRYDITNVNAGETLELLMGNFSDLDLGAYDSGTNVCGPDPHHNQTSYDEARGMSFIYFSPHPEDGDLDPTCYGYVDGVAFLELSAGGVPDGVWANRIVTRYGALPYYSYFSEEDITDAEDAFFALNGLDPDGVAMVNPVTNQTTRFAFTGDPVAGTGWLDERNDSRQLLSRPPFSLGEGETKSVVVVIMKAEGEDLGQAIGALQDKYDLVAGSPSIWDK